MNSPVSPPPLSTRVEWLFIDVGGVLLDDQPLLDALYLYFADWLSGHGVVVTVEELLRTRDRFTRQGKDQVYKRVLDEHASDSTMAQAALTDFRTWLEPRQFALNPLLLGVDKALEELSQSCHLALAANQGGYIHDLLEKHGIRHFFKEAFIAGELGVSKPDQRFFGTMLSRTGCAPEHAVMIGDSLPNDILPAIRIGMRTILVTQNAQQLSGLWESSMASGIVSALSDVPLLLRGWFEKN